ncbi:MAG: hypothetical protein TR69_WS6001001544 [candidate division WS6 bacterium OLB20]|uniref:Pyrroloquinoline quinone-dependent pyranose dehydrogenase beta-propeller domain-containing protein n=1 Tax=candidate division WS6 bacterium OLB20 TaxID=1617426 RepID=A0A136LVQ9_9BACT|nr:MAG: hypothetical protein TR69_WS6001001544 [candidate division WS6 bacterium OLB20]
MSKRQAAAVTATGVVLILSTLAILVFAFRGAIPAFVPPGQDIAELIRSGASPLSAPEDVRISIFSDDLEKPRDLLAVNDRWLLVSEMGAGRITAFDRTTGSLKPVIDNLNTPHGLTMHCIEDGCRLYVAETARVSSYYFNPDTAEADFDRELVSLPGPGGHFTRSLLLPDDSTLLISVGSSCNVCIEDDYRRAAVLSYDLQEGTLNEYATGLRNSVFLTKRPGTDEIWATDNGRDNLGDDLPPDEVNIITAADYGWPFCYGDRITDTTFSSPGDFSCNDTQGSQIDLQAHSAALGLGFFGPEWSEYQGDLLVAYHGSWNRSIPTGYKLVRFDLDASSLEPEDFITGWLSDFTAIGRPVDIEFAGGDMYVSDDHAGVIYLIRPD